VTRPARTWLVAGGSAAIVVATNASEGAYFSQSWGWVALAFLIPVTLALILGVVELPGRLRVAFAVLIGLLAAWIALSATWSVSSAASIREVERVLVYVAVALVVALLLRRGDGTGVIGGAFAGTVAVMTYALATRLFPDRFEIYDVVGQANRLSEPIGYWNSLGLLAAMGVLLGLGIVAHARSDWLRASAAGALPVVGTALYFTFSRGAWGALVVGYVATVAIDPRRVRLLWTTLAVGPATALLVAVASRQEALTMEEPSIVEAVAQGERVAGAVVVAVLVSALLGLLAGRVARRVAVSARRRRLVDIGLVAAAVVALVGIVAAGGGPREITAELEERFNAELVTTTPGALNERLFSFSGTGRTEQLEVAWDMATERPIVGHGAGTYEYFWYERRQILFDIRDAHSLYAETLAEIGLVGLALLVSVLVVLLVAIARARRHRLVAAAGGAYVAWAAHSALDWNWEVVGVTITALLVGGAGLLASERRRGAPLRDRVRAPLVALTIVLSVAATISLVGNQALFAARDDVARRDYADAVDHAQRAEQLLPWSHEPEVALGDAAAGLGDRAAALRAYRDAVATNPLSWPAWLRLAQVARGEERTRAYARVRELNPREEKLPGERRSP
jgi:O-Antigen ligase